MSSGTGWLMISLKNFSPNSILLSHSEGTLGLRSLAREYQRNEESG